MSCALCRDLRAAVSAFCSCLLSGRACLSFYHLTLVMSEIVNKLIKFYNICTWTKALYCKLFYTRKQTVSIHRWHWHNMILNCPQLVTKCCSIVIQRIRSCIVCDSNVISYTKQPIFTQWSGSHLIKILKPDNNISLNKTAIQVKRMQ